MLQQKGDFFRSRIPLFLRLATPVAVPAPLNPQVLEAHAADAFVAPLLLPFMRGGDGDGGASPLQQDIAAAGDGAVCMASWSR